MIWTIYIISNILDGKIYIGQTTKTLEHRWARHCKKDNKCIRLRNAIQKYGSENFIIEPIVYAETQKDADDLEIFLIEQYKTQDDAYGYNICSGGSGGMLGRHHTEETKKKLSDNNKGKSYNIGIKRSAETIQKLSDSHKGIATRTGHKATPETIQKLSDSHKGIIQSTETRLKRSISVKANYKVMPEEIKNKILEYIKSKSDDIFTQNDKEYIRQLVRDGYQQKDIADIFCKSRTQISRIVNSTI